jgi:His-Xaa-Ser system radical SAM maturase HxsB
MVTPMSVQNSNPSFPALFQFRQLDDCYLVTNPVGDYVFLSVSEFAAFVEGRLPEDNPLSRTLAEKNFVRSSVNVAALAERVAKSKSFLDYGPNLHVVELTLRCNQTCTYCHSSRASIGEAGKDMSVETADKVLDLIFQSTCPSLTIEFQGGEPLANFDVLRHLVDNAIERNKAASKSLSFSLVTNLSLMDDEKLAYLLDRRVQICTSIDGPRLVHNQQRRLPSGNAYDVATAWTAKLNRAYADAQLDPEVYHVEGLLTVTRETLEYPRQVIDTYVELGFRAVFLRPLDPFGFASKNTKLAYTPAEYLKFYGEALDYILELNLSGTKILERYAAILLTKILTGEDPNFLDLRSPCGAGIGQIAYGFDGQIFTCDEARMLNHMGDDFFVLGSVNSATYQRIVTHDTVKALLLGSMLQASPDCSVCVYNPYCGICPVHNYATQGNIHARMQDSSWCAILMGIQDLLFRKLRQADPQVMEVFRRWITTRPREHYLHLGAH